MQKTNLNGHCANFQNGMKLMQLISQPSNAIKSLCKQQKLNGVGKIENAVNNKLGKSVMYVQKCNQIAVAE